MARLLAEAYFIQPIVWSPETLRQLLFCAGLTDIQLWNSDVSRAVSHGRVLIGSSIAALARKPG